MKPVWMLCAWLLAGPAWAHGDAKHPDKAKPVVLEQKPWGIAAKAHTVTRTIEVTMDDRMRFTPDAITVREGERVRLRVHNAGKTMHELVLGTHDELMAHAQLMKRFPGMEHDEPYMAHVAPGGRADIDWTFNRAGQFEFACLLPGHFDAGMKGSIAVVNSGKKP
jgi:uncharacterized cupredoxin-like copper-binding protein